MMAAAPLPISGTAPDWDRPGFLSIVVQGGLSPRNAAETASHCQHWRALFPGAEIILAISTTDLISGAPRSGATRGVRLVPAHRDNGSLQAALRVILASCDKVVVSEGALPLPSIKTISEGANNINLQIVAAQAGLALVTGQYVLRVRGDLIFQDRSFLDQHRRGNAMARGDAARFAGRVLISNLFTLNPYTYERMPLHFSDWFHFGATSDVRRIWNVPQMSLADATHYKTHRCAPDSTLDERVFVPRLAVEQHILYHCFKPDFPSLVLDYHNDVRSRELSLDILADNFVIADLSDAKCVFDKYSKDFDNPAKALHCLNRGQWREMTSRKGAARYAVLASKLIAVEHPERVRFPRRYPAGSLSTKIGSHNHGAILGAGRPGVLLHGPYDALPRGRYLATLDVKVLKGSGGMDLRVTLGAGWETLAERRIWLEAHAPAEVAIPFEVRHHEAKLLEVVAEVDGLATLVVSGMTISAHADVAEELFPRRFGAADGEIPSQVGVVHGDRLRTSGSAGHLLYGPYLKLAAGAYRLTIASARALSPGRSFLEVVVGPHHAVLSRRRIRWSDLLSGALTHEFRLERDAEDVEFRISVDRTARFEVRELSLDRVEG